MNSITFYVDEYEQVLECIYCENNKEKKPIEINLPSIRLHNILFEYIRKNYYAESSEKNKINKLVFYDIDVLTVDSLIKESEKYKKDKNTFSCNVTTPIKVKRKNKFNKTFVTASTTVLLALTLFSITKESIKFIPHDGSYSISYENFKQGLTERIKDNLHFYKDNIENDYEILSDLIHKPVENKSDAKELSPILYTEIDDNSTEIVLKEDTNNENDKEDNCITPNSYLELNAEDLVTNEKYFIAKEYYYDSLSDIAKRYGVDPNLALAIGIHERGIHSSMVDSGGAIGLFQIQVEGGWNWNNRTITAYNFDTNEYENVTITTDIVSDVFNNIKVGCMMLQNLLVTYDYNVAKAVTAYNYGSENLRLVLEKCSLETGLSIEELSNNNNTEWLKYRDIIKGGDPEYLENVCKYISNGTILSFIKPNDEHFDIEYVNSNYEVTRPLIH